MNGGGGTLVKSEGAYPKSERILRMYTKLIDGKTVYKKQAAREYNVVERTIERDISEMNNYYANLEGEGDEKYKVEPNEKQQSYRLEDLEGNIAGIAGKLTENEVLAVCKILLESRSMVKEELFPILDKLVNNCIDKDDSKRIKAILGNEKIHYIAPRHKKEITRTISTLSRAIKEQKKVKILYGRTKENSLVERTVKPVGIMFSEFYFYLAAYIEGIDKETRYENPDDIFPTIYRVDRIKEFTVLEEKFPIPNSDRFEEGVFRKRMQFMYGGRLERVKFEYSGSSIEAVLDRLPTAKILSEENGKYVITAEVFGKGIYRYLLSLGSEVKAILPSGFVREMKKEATKLAGLYEE